MLQYPILAVDKNIKVSEEEQAAWVRHGISTVRVNSMQQAIEKLASEPFLFIIVNGDNVNFLPLLSVMRDMTDTLIYIIDSDHVTEQEIEALNNGADAYATFSGDAETNVQLALALLLRHNERDNQPRMPAGMMIFERYLIMTTSRRIFFCDEKLDLTSKEYELLHYFIVNHDHSLTYRQIYRKIWRRDMDGDPHRSIWNFINKIRRKIEAINDEHDYFVTKRDYGYYFSALREVKLTKPVVEEP